MDQKNPSENIKVAIRIRPTNKRERDDPDKSIGWTDNSVSVPGHEFVFDRVFSPSVTQEFIFTDVAKNAVEWVCQGYNSTIFVYGATSSGKTFTMFGDADKKGIIPRACELLFHTININENVTDANMKCSFAEIYKESIRDLLAENNLSAFPLDKNSSLRIRQSDLKGIFVQGLVEKYVYSPQEILSVIKIGAQQRATASTALNSTSSRSHAVLTLTLYQKLSDGSELTSKLHMIDLAGSENVGRSEVQGNNLAEAQMINKSLSCLGNVIYALTEKDREHIPYRDSKLTYLLQDSLGGNSKTIIIATISPASSSLSETISTLKFACRAKQIKNIPKVNRNESVANLLKIIEELNRKIVDLEKKCQDSTVIIQEVEKSTDENKVDILLKTKCDRLEQRVVWLEQEILAEENRNKKFLQLYEKQRKHAQIISRDLSLERIKNGLLLHELQQHRLLYNSLKESKPELLEIVVAKANIPIVEMNSLPISSVTLSSENSSENGGSI